MPKYMNLREEDRQLLLHLHDFIYLTKEFIEKHIYKSYTNSDSIYRRLRDLKENGYIRVYSLQVKENSHKNSHVYTLTKFGVAEVEVMRGVVHWKDHWSTGDPPNWWKHELLIAEVVKAYETQAPNFNLEMTQWIPGARAYYEFPAINKAIKTKSTIRPDGVITISKKDQLSSLGFMVEMERSHSSRERTVRKIDQFNEFFSRRAELMDEYQRHVAFDLPVVAWKILFIGGDETKTNKLLRHLGMEKAEVPILVASKQAIEAEPFGKIYRDTRNPEEYTTL